MRKKLKLYLKFAVLAGCFVLISHIFGLAQSSDNEKKLRNNFGESLAAIKKQNETESIKPTGSADDEIIRIETTLIINDVCVFDEQGNYVNGLKREDFVIKEDDELQEIESFSSGGESIPRSIVLIIDYSGSQLPYIKTSVEAAKILVDRLSPKDRMAIVTDDVELLQDFTADKSLLRQKLESLKQSALSGKMGQSRQYGALMATLNELFNGEHLRPIIIFQTDGDELIQLKGETGNSLFPSLEPIKFGYKDILTAAEKKRAVVYTVIPGRRFIGVSENERLKRAKTELEDGLRAFAETRRAAFQPDKIKVTEDFLSQRFKERFRQQTAIAQIAKLTGGWAEFLEHPKQADEIYSKIISEMNRRYVIGYYPKNQARNGKRREVKTEVRGHPEYTIRGRKTYILPEN